MANMFSQGSIGERIEGDREGRRPRESLIDKNRGGQVKKSGQVEINASRKGLPQDVPTAKSARGVFCRCRRQTEKK